MEFMRWPSIENTYRTKELSRWTMRLPALIEAEYIITEKLHGSNVQVSFSPTGEIGYGSRNQWIDADGALFGCFPKDIQELIALADWPTFCGLMTERAQNADCIIRLYGELFGPGIQKGVAYRPEKEIRWFGCRFGDELQSLDMLGALVYFMTIVPVMARVDGLQSALDYDTSFPSRLNPEPDNLCEGIVITPATPVRWEDSWFMLKKKNEAFKEKQHAKKEKVPDAIVDPLAIAFRAYITDARMQSVFSKEGPITSKKDMGKYIRWILADAQEDLEKDYPEVVGLDKGQRKAVFNVGSAIAKMLLGEM